MLKPILVFKTLTDLAKGTTTRKGVGSKSQAHNNEEDNKLSLHFDFMSFRFVSFQ